MMVTTSHISAVPYGHHFRGAVYQISDTAYIIYHNVISRSIIVPGHAHRLGTDPGSAPVQSQQCMLLDPDVLIHFDS